MSFKQDLIKTVETILLKHGQTNSWCLGMTSLSLAEEIYKNHRQLWDPLNIFVIKDGQTFRPRQEIGDESVYCENAVWVVLNELCKLKDAFLFRDYEDDWGHESLVTLNREPTEEEKIAILTEIPRPEPFQTKHYYTRYVVPENEHTRLLAMHPSAKKVSFQYYYDKKIGMVYSYVFE